MESIFDRLRKAHIEEMNQHYYNFAFVVECGDHVVLATNDEIEAIKAGSFVAGSMAAYVYKNSDKGFNLFITFHGDPAHVDFDVEALTEILNNRTSWMH